MTFLTVKIRCGVSENNIHNCRFMERYCFDLYRFWCKNGARVGSFGTFYSLVTCNCFRAGNGRRHLQVFLWSTLKIVRMYAMKW